MKWFHQAAERGYDRAQFKLGAFYKDGYEGVNKDEEEAVQWYHQAAEQGNVYAQCSLGRCYQFGCGINKDEAKAAKWYRKAADQGDRSAWRALRKLRVSHNCC